MTEWDKSKGTLIGMIVFNIMSFPSALAVPATDGPQLLERRKLGRSAV
jgi:hypothetical protein